MNDQNFRWWIFLNLYLKRVKASIHIFCSLYVLTKFDVRGYNFLFYFVCMCEKLKIRSVCLREYKSDDSRWLATGIVSPVDMNREDIITWCTMCRVTGCLLKLWSEIGNFGARNEDYPWIMLTGYIERARVVFVLLLGIESFWIRVDVDELC